MAASSFRRAGTQNTGGGGSASGPPDRVPLLALLEPDLRQRVRKRLSHRRIGAHKPLFRVDEPADALYIVDTGRFRLYVSDPRGQQRVLRFSGPGDVLGEAAFMAETPHVTNAVAIDNASVWRLARVDFDALLGSNDAVLRYLASIIAERQAQANARLAADTAPDEARTQRGFVTAVYSPRGGAGVTTLAVAISIALAERHPDDTVLLDLDVLFGHALSNLWLESRGVLAQMTPLSMQALDRTGLDFYLIPHPSSLRIFPSASRPEEGQAITGEHVRAALSTLRRHFGHIVLDLPHGFSEVTLAGLELADRVLLVATPELVTLHDVLECRRIFGEVLRLPADRVSYVLNHPLPYASASVGDFGAATGAPWREVPFGGESPTAAALRGESLVNTRPNNPVTRAAIDLAETLSTEARELAVLSGRPI
ncbi:MAG TPA: cyclic nucleotide-binding domain-containing protein [Chloroflexota bacterium]|jgi:Flp pilus assembly CpaE family ATPase